MGKGPAHCEWDHPWAGSPGIYKKAGWASHLEQASIINPPCPLHLLLPPRYRLAWVTTLTAFEDNCSMELWVEVSPFLPKKLSSWCSITAALPLGRTLCLGSHPVQYLGFADSWGMVHLETYNYAPGNILYQETATLFLTSFWFTRTRVELQSISCLGCSILSLHTPSHLYTTAF